jgi:hypothetical protein
LGTFLGSPEERINGVNWGRDEIIPVFEVLVDSEIAFNFVDGGVIFLADVNDVVVFVILPDDRLGGVVVIITMLLFIEIPDNYADELFFFESLEFISLSVDRVEFLVGRVDGFLRLVGLNVQS